MKRILFVDDEPHILEGLRRSLRSQRKQWDMSFAEGGEQALAVMESKPIDVVVSDMRMPRMDGAALLTHVRNRFPGVVRIVLSGYFDTEAALRSVPVAHQFLAKPCDAGQLREAIDRCCRLYAVLADETTRRVVGAIGELPALPRTSAALVRALEDPGIAIEKIASIIEGDVAMTAKVLQLANSAFFTLSREVTDLRLAVGYLGLDVLRQLVVSVELFQAFPSGEEIAGFSLGDFQHHCVLTARIAGRLPLPGESRHAAVVAALLHDAGMLVLAARLPEQFAAVQAAAHASRRPLYEVEREMAGVTHAEIGAYLLGLWGLPNAIVVPVARHHSPGQDPSAALGLDSAAVVYIADCLANELRVGQPGFEAPVHAGLNAGCLREWNVVDEVPAWREMAAGIARELRNGHAAGGLSGCAKDLHVGEER